MTNILKLYPPGSYSPSADRTAPKGSSTVLGLWLSYWPGQARAPGAPACTGGGEPAPCADGSTRWSLSWGLECGTQTQSELSSVEPQGTGVSSEEHGWVAGESGSTEAETEQRPQWCEPTSPSGHR